MWPMALATVHNRHILVFMLLLLLVNDLHSFHLHTWAKLTSKHSSLYALLLTHTCYGVGVGPFTRYAEIINGR